MGKNTSVLCCHSETHNNLINDRHLSTTSSNSNTTKKTTLEDFNLIHAPLKQVIGRGSFGKVYLVERKYDKAVFALKSLKKEILDQRHQVNHTKS